METLYSKFQFRLRAASFDCAAKNAAPLRMLS